MGPRGNLSLQVDEYLVNMLATPSTHQTSCHTRGVEEKRQENKPTDLVTILYKYFNYTTTFLFIVVLSLTCVITRKPHFSIIIVLTIFLLLIIFEYLE